MTEGRPFTVTGQGRIPLSYEEATLEAAIYLATKMASNGVTDVRLLDPDGKEVPRSEWDKVDWWNNR